MRKITSALLLGLFVLGVLSHPRGAHAQVRPYGAPTACNSAAYYDASTSGDTQMVAASSGKTIYICGYTIVSGGTVNLSFQQGTGTNCGTGTATMTPAFHTAANGVITDSSEFWRGLSTMPGQALCIDASSGVAAQVIVYYSQF